MVKFELENSRHATVAILALLCLMFGARPSAFAISKVPATPAAPHPTPQLPTSPDASAPAQQNEATALSKIVGRLAARENRTARDWAELGRETVTWGSRLQSQQQPVPEGPVRDALAAVDLGAKLDKSAADWPKLREELETLLKKPEDEKEQDKQKQQQQQQQNPQDKNEQQQNQDQQKQDQNKSDQQKQQNDSQKQNEQEKNQQSSGEQPQQKQEPKPQGESAFGDMTKKDEPPPPPPESMQKVGGAPEKKEEQKEPLDPALALPMQKLEQLKNQDSPAQLFQLMEGEKKPTKKTGKDW